MEHIARSMFSQSTSLAIEQGKTKLQLMSWEFAPKTCNSFMFYPGGRGLLPILKSYVMQSNGLRVPQGYYYLCDAGYANADGFLTPFRGQRYHLSEWRQGGQPRTPQELFNLRHSSARNVIERSFGLLKMRWAILRGRSFYPMKTQCRMIIACALLHNHVRREMPIAPFEEEICEDIEEEEIEGNWISYVETSDAWTNWRQNLAVEMFNQWTAYAQN